MKNARFYLASIFILFGLLCFGCSNAASDTNDAGGGGESKNISAAQVEGGISVTVDIPEGCTINYFFRQKSGSNYQEAWYCNENTPSGSNTVVDYFVEQNATYTYWVEFRDSNWAVKGKSDSVEITSSAKGFALPKVTNTPKATYNFSTRKFTFSTKPTFSYTQCPVDGYPNLKIELLYKCADNKYENICEYKLDEDQTGSLYNWIFERYTGNNLKFHAIRYKFKSADGKRSYEFDIGLDAAIGDVDLQSISYTCICGGNTPNGIQKQTAVFNFNMVDKTFSVVMDGYVGTTGTYTGNPAINGRVVATVLSTVADDQDYTNYKINIDILNNSFLFDGMGEFVTSKTFRAVYYYQSPEDTPSSGENTEDNIAFYSDGTFSVYEKIEGQNASGEHELIFSEIVGRGTYTGNPATDGTISVKMLQMMNNEGTELESLSEPQPQTLIISNKQFQSISGGTQLVTYTRVYPD